MDDRELYATILRIARPWSVARVELKEHDEVVERHVAPVAGTTCRCPTCDGVVPGYDHVERRWRHLDTCQF